MPLDTKFILDEITRLFAEQNAKWDARFATAPGFGVHGSAEPLREVSASGEHATPTILMRCSTDAPSELAFTIGASGDGEMMSTASTRLRAASSVPSAEETLPDTSTAAAAAATVNATLGDLALDAPTKCSTECPSRSISVLTSTYVGKTMPPSSMMSPSLGVSIPSLVMPISSPQVHLSSCTHLMFKELRQSETLSWNNSMSFATSRSTYILLAIVEFPRDCLFQFEPNIVMFSISKPSVSILLPSTSTGQSVLQQSWPPPTLLMVFSDMSDMGLLPWPFFFMVAEDFMIWSLTWLWKPPWLHPDRREFRYAIAVIKDSLEQMMAMSMRNSTRRGCRHRDPSILVISLTCVLLLHDWAIILLTANINSFPKGLCAISDLFVRTNLFKAQFQSCIILPAKFSLVDSHQFTSKYSAKWCFCWHWKPPWLLPVQSNIRCKPTMQYWEYMLLTSKKFTIVLAVGLLGLSWFGPCVASNITRFIELEPLLHLVMISVRLVESHLWSSPTTTRIIDQRSPVVLVNSITEIQRKCGGVRGPIMITNFSNDILGLIPHIPTVVSSIFNLRELLFAWDINIFSFEANKATPSCCYEIVLADNLFVEPWNIVPAKMIQLPWNSGAVQGVITMEGYPLPLLLVNWCVLCWRKSWIAIFAHLTVEELAQKLYLVVSQKGFIGSIGMALLNSFLIILKNWHALLSFISPRIYILAIECLHF